VKRLLVIGGSDAGISAALRAREVDPSWEVTLVCADAFPNFSICGLPFFLSGETPRWQSLAHRKRADIESRGIALVLDCVAESVDPPGHSVRAKSADGKLRSLSYDRLVIATGAVPAPPPIAGLDTPGVYPLHTMGESFAVHDYLESRKPRRAVIIGGGYIGVEMADALRHRGLHITLLEAGASVLQTVDPDFGTRVREELARHEVEVRFSARVERIASEGSELLVRGSGFDPIRTELVLVVTGVQPNVALGLSAGIRQGVRVPCAWARAWRPMSRTSLLRATASRRVTVSSEIQRTSHSAPRRTSRGALPARTRLEGTRCSRGALERRS
jgi:NADPH-dependent 2,4-dienoyl-CoA reductase/sulfur reductase-like enzyme